ncbi:segregation/condensation protein A [Candidatus Parcubacteria bacterium]|nr:MAG: segregation/condensation protein A [Candidatus Parcubacteria bacterium]
MEYELRLEQFNGPISKLLELIEEKQLEITEINLAEVTDDFLKHIRTLERVETPFLADFIAVASRLIFIKSKILLPEFQLSGEEEAAIKDLERRLTLYRELKPAMKAIAKFWRAGNQEFARPYFLNVTFLDPKQGASIFYPGERLAAELLVGSLERILDVFRKLELETQTIKETIVTIEEKIREIIARLQKQGATSVKNLSRGRSVSEIIAIFLAILHLAREQAVRLEQDGHFSDIIIKHSRSPGDIQL